MYRDDEAARGARADALIQEIAELERQKVARAEQDHRLEAARLELAMLQPPLPPEEPRPPNLFVHLAVFAAAAGTTFAAYTIFL